jgi:hypothetical protein
MAESSNATAAIFGLKVNFDPHKFNAASVKFTAQLSDSFLGDLVFLGFFRLPISSYRTLLPPILSASGLVPTRSP